MTGDCVCGSLFMKIYSNFLNIYYSFTRSGNEADDFYPSDIFCYFVKENRGVTCDILFWEHCK